MSSFRLPIEKIERFISYESFFLLIILILIAYFFYKVFLKKISLKRHENLKARFTKVYSYLFISIGLSIIHWTMIQSSWIEYFSLKIANYIGLLSFIIVVTVIIRLSQIYVYSYLFWANMSQGVPRLITNIFTLVFSTILLSWIAAEVFNFDVATVLATSAIFTIVLGLALQDTLGNLFSGVALQMERPFNIGDWVEIHNQDEHWVGQIQEITWRATSLTGFGEELIIIPNKIIAQSQLLVFSPKGRPARFNQEFKFKLDANIIEIKETITKALLPIAEIVNDPEPRLLVGEVTEQWVSLKIFYSVQDYGLKYRIGDRVNLAVVDALRTENIRTAHPLLVIRKDE